MRLFLKIFISALSLLKGPEVFAQSSFIENKGQWHSDVLFQYEFGNKAVFLLKDGFVTLEIDSVFWATVVQHPDGIKVFKAGSLPNRFKYHVVKTRFPECSKTAVITGKKPLSHQLNYFIDNNSKNWKSGVRAYQEVYYTEFYPGIDMQVFAYPYGIKYNFILKKSASATAIKWVYEGALQTRLSANQITISTSVNQMYELLPEVFTLKDGIKTTVQAAFTKHNGQFGFALNSSSDFDQLIIDPQLVFSTYAGNTVDNFGFTATYDKHGNLYAGGIATGPTLFINGRYPATPGAFDETYNGGTDNSDGMWSYYFECDITLSKYSSDGKTLLYATYLGGNQNEYPHSIVVDNNDELIVMGTSFSPNFPTTGGSYQPLRGGKNDIVVAKFNANCSQLVGSTFFGGSDNDGLNQASVLKYFYADDFRGEVLVDSNGYIYVASSTVSDDLPLKNVMIKGNRSGMQDGLLIKFNPVLTDVIWSTYLGGNSDDALYSIDFDLSGNIFVSGGTKSNNILQSSGGVYPFFRGGTCDGFITSIKADGSSILKSTYFGTDKYDQIFGLEIDKENKVYIVGQTHGAVPISSKVYAVPNSGQFLAKLSNDLTAIEWSTLWGTGDGAPDITINAFLVDECQKIFVSGWGGGSSTKSFSSTRNLAVTSDAVQKTTDGSDFYLAVFSKNAQRLAYATYFGGDKTHDHVDGGTSRFDKKGVIYQSVCASCPEFPGQSKISDFPTTKGAYAETNQSPRCSNATFKIEFGNLNRAPLPADTFFEITALDTVAFKYYLHDPDDDTLFVTYTPDNKTLPTLINFKANDVGFESVTTLFNISASCKNASGDTLLIKVYAKDKGCPDYKDSTAFIRIKVNPPPPVSPPPTICLNFNQDYLKLSWDQSLPSKYFQYLLLYKISPAGKISIIDTIYHQKSGEFLDYNAPNAKLINYRYFLIAQNRCGLKGDTSIIVSSTQEYEIPIEPTYVITATVVNNKNIKLVWEASQEPDFGSYDIYRKNNFDKTEFEYVTTIGSRFDTIWIDENTQVEKQSYCYALVVNDNCGHISKISNKGCTIVLTGEEHPFYFNLFWNFYEDWPEGVENYTLLRSVDTGILRPIVVNTILTSFYKDGELDYDWGGYWYKISADENPGKHNAVSESNSIYLIQPPLLHVPNAFTPNGDMLNEKWGIVPVFVKEYVLNVYNRWGEKVFETNDKHHIWSGFYKDEITSNNVYIYHIMFTGWDNSVHYRKGTVTILK